MGNYSRTARPQRNIDFCGVLFSVTPPSYDGHIHLYGYPFLDSKAEFTHNSLACDVMKPGKNEPPLTVVDLSECTIGERVGGLVSERASGRVGD